jgi:hypothetical protein
VNLKVVVAPIKVHFQKKFCLTQVLDLKFGFNFFLQDKWVTDNDNKIFNVCKNPGGWLGMESWMMKDAGVGYSGSKPHTGKECAELFVPLGQHLIKPVNGFIEVLGWVWWTFKTMQQKKSEFIN